MISLRWLTRTMLTAAMLAGGCDRSASAPTTQTTAAPATQAPGDDASATRPVAAVITINGRATVFPAARLRLEREGERLIAMLFSDDPPEALKSNYAGNSFYLRMQLDISDPAELGQADWRYQAPSSADREDSPYGIFLTGRQTQLQPFDVRASFRRDSEKHATVVVGGQFQIIDPANERGPAQMANIVAELAARLDKVPAATQ